MTSTSLHTLLLILLMSLVTILIRFSPFLIFRKSDRRPAFVNYLGTVLPYSVMGMLVVYCLKSTSILAAPHGLPELIAVSSVVLLHLWKKNTLLSIFGGTAIYMLLVQLVFV